MQELQESFVQDTQSPEILGTKSLELHFWQRKLEKLPVKLLAQGFSETIFLQFAW